MTLPASLHTYIITAELLTVFVVKHFFLGVGTSRPLLTANGTPATTPSYEAQQSLGQSSSNTPASTPTEMQDLQLATSQGQSTEANTYQEIGNNHTPHHAPTAAASSTVVSHTSQDIEFQSTVISSQREAPRPPLTVGAGAPAPPPAPPPRQTPHVYVPNPPRVRVEKCMQ